MLNKPALYCVIYDRAETCPPFIYPMIRSFFGVYIVICLLLESQIERSTFTTLMLFSQVQPAKAGAEDLGKRCILRRDLLSVDRSIHNGTHYTSAAENCKKFLARRNIGRNCQREGKFPRRSRVISRGAAVLGSGINGYRTSGTPNFVCRAQTRPDAPTSIRLARPYKVPPGIARGHRLLH